MNYNTFLILTKIYFRHITSFKSLKLLKFSIQANFYTQLKKKENFVDFTFKQEQSLATNLVVV